MSQRKWLFLAGGALAVLAVGVGLTYALQSDDEADLPVDAGLVGVPPTATTGPSPTPSATSFLQYADTNATPVPGATPDTTKALWYVPYHNADQALPRYDIVVAGIAVGPGVTRVIAPCPGDSTGADYESAFGSPLSVELAYTPDDLTEPVAVGPGSEVSLCDGQPHFTFAHFSITPEPSDLTRILAGEITWFEARHGGSLDIGRWYGEPAAYSHIATERWHETTVNGFPAAAAGPILEAGYGPSAVFVYANGVMTTVEGDGMTLEELLLVAEGLTY